MWEWSRTRPYINLKGHTWRKILIYIYFCFTQSWPSAKQAQIRRQSSDYDFDFLVHISKLIWGLEMTFTPYGGNIFIPLTSFDCQSFSYVLMKHWTILTHTHRNRKNQWGNMDNIRSHVVISGKVRTSISTVACQVDATDIFESRKNIF